MKYNVIKNGEVVKKKLSKKQAEDYCEKMNQEFMDSQEETQKRKQKSGLPLRKNKYELYKVEVVKENVIKLTESDLMRIVKRVIKEQENEMSEEEIIKLLIDTAEYTPTEDYDDVYDWMNVIFSQVEYELEDVYDDVDDLREKYDYVLMNMWGREWWGID